jgi:large repetitive protein
VAPVFAALQVDEVRDATTSAATLSGRVADVGLADTHEIRIQWGDGTTATVAVDPTTRTFTASHVFAIDAVPGYRLLVTAVDDDGGESTTTIDTIGYLANRRPVAVDDEATTEQGVVIELPLLRNDRDPDGDPLVTHVQTLPANGLLLPLGDGRFRYLPNAGFTGTDSFTYRVSDGELSSNAAIVTINVLDRNAAPVAAPDTRSTAEDTAITFDPRGNDSDADGDALSIVGLTSPSNGLVGLNADGSITYTPDANFFGTDTFTYAVSDGRATSNTATITILVESRNDAPVAVPDTRSTAEDTAITFDPRGNDSDADGDGLTIVGLTSPANGTVGVNADGTITYTPMANFFGTDAFTYAVSDGQATSNVATITIVVESRNDAPVATDDPFVIREGRTLTVTSATLLANDSDPEGDPINVIGFGGAVHGTVSFDGTQFVYTPVAGFSGEDAFTYRISDGIDSASAAVKITVVDNQAPVAMDDSYVIREGRTLTVTSATLLADDSDPEGDLISITGFGGASNGTVSFDGTQFLYTPNAGFSGEDTFTYHIGDGIDSDTAVVRITVVANQAPIAQDDLASTGTGVPLVLQTTALVANDSDPEGDPISITAFSGASNGSVSFDGTTFTYTPNA